MKMFANSTLYSSYFLLQNQKSCVIKGEENLWNERYIKETYIGSDEEEMLPLISFAPFLNYLSFKILF